MHWYMRMNYLTWIKQWQFLSGVQELKEELQIARELHNDLICHIDN